MRYEGIIVTGTRCGGKSTLAKKLCQQDMRFVHVKAVTTRPRRKDDTNTDYDHMSMQEFNGLRENSSLLVDTTYGTHCYGIRHNDVKHITEQDKIPLMTITPESAYQLYGLNTQIDDLAQPRYLTVFLDADDDALNSRLLIRDNSPVNEELNRQREKDRTFKYGFVVRTVNANIDSLVSLIISMWNNSDIGGVLPARLIHLMLQSGTLLEESSATNVSGASYDLSLGDEYFYRGRIHHLSESDPILLIEPYDYAIVTSKEIASFPNDICARFDLTVSLFCQGVILSNGPQIDPGFQGPLFCLLFNTSSSPVMIKRSQHYATLEFHKLIEPTHSYEGHHRGKHLLHYLPANATQGGISDLKKELEQLRSESSNLRDMTWALLSLFLAIIAIWVSLK